jgi:intein/homing endonuclease
MDEKFAEFIGIYIGDGCLTIREEKHSHEFKIVGNPKKDFPYFRDYVSKLASHAVGRRVGARIMDKGRSVGVYFCSKRLAERFSELGFHGGPKAERIRIPDEIMEIECLRKACIRGIFDTDGCFTIKKRGKREPYYPVVTFSMKNREVISQIGAALGMDGIPHSKSFDLESYDKRTGKTYSKHFLSIYGFVNVGRWFEIFGSRNPWTNEKFRKFKKENSGRWI